MKKIVFTCCILILSGLGSAAADTQKKKNLSPVIYLLLSDSAPDLDCNSDLGGSAYIDSCGVCVGGNTGKTASEVSCITSTTGQVWMDRNLGASRVSQSYDDEEAYGDLYQWGRGTDGHEKRDSDTTSTQSSTSTPGHGSFIIGWGRWFIMGEVDYESLWQGVSGVNNPCPSGFRLPTEVEYNNERAASWPNTSEWFRDFLMFTVPGYRMNQNGNLVGEAYSGFYWTSTIETNHPLIKALRLYFGSVLNVYSPASYEVTDGFSVRCIKD